MQRAQTRLITTEAVFVEIGNALAKSRFRAAGVQLLSSLATDPQVEIVAVTTELLAQAWHLYQQRTDKEWGLTDCISFVVMSTRGLREALRTITFGAIFSHFGSA
jgi:predicted nucleic acid-binding protein